MLVFRPTKMLAARLKLKDLERSVSASSPYLDWSAHTFIGARYRYLIVTNSASLFSIVVPQAGVTSADAFIRTVGAALERYLEGCGRRSIFTKHIAPHLGEVVFARFTDRGVMGSMNDYVYTARDYLLPRGVSPVEIADQLNETPMFYLEKVGRSVFPDQAFDSLAKE